MTIATKVGLLVEVFRGFQKILDGLQWVHSLFQMTLKTIWNFLGIPENYWKPLESPFGISWEHKAFRERLKTQ